MRSVVREEFIRRPVSREDALQSLDHRFFTQVLKKGYFRVPRVVVCDDDIPLCFELEQVGCDFLPRALRERCRLALFRFAGFSKFYGAISLK